MSILIVGASGKIGYELFCHYNNHAIGTFINNAKKPISGDYIKLDLSDLKMIDEFVNKNDSFKTVLFLVGLAHTKGKGKELAEFKRINYQTLQNLLNAFAANNKMPEKIIFASTIAIYGEKIDQYYYDELFSPQPSSPYAISKFMAENYLLKKYKSCSWILRFAPVYFSDFMLNINRRTKILNYFYQVGNGSNKLSLCNINNIKSAVEGIINGKVPAGVYNIADTNPYSYKELLNWQDASLILRSPKIMVKMLYYCGKLFRNIFLQENTIKLLTDNIYPNTKIMSFIELPYTLNDILPKHKENS